TNPGASFTSTGVFSSFTASSRTVSNVVCEVARPRITSTSFITGTGLKKCIPITLSARPVSAPIFVIEIEDVFVARITSGFGFIRRSSSRKISALISNFSVAASIARSQSASFARSMTALMRPSVETLSAAVILLLATSRSRFFAIVASPRSRNRSSTSHSTTLNPHRANTWAIPLPIVPAPITPTNCIAIIASCAPKGTEEFSRRHTLFLALAEKKTRVFHFSRSKSGRWTARTIVDSSVGDGGTLLFFRNVQTRFRALQCVFGARVVHLNIVALQALFGPVFRFLRALYVNFMRTLRRFRQNRHLVRQHFHKSPRH